MTSAVIQLVVTRHATDGLSPMLSATILSHTAGDIIIGMTAKHAINSRR